MAFPLTSIPGLNISGENGGGAPGISAGVYAWMRARGLMWVSDPTFAGGAVGDDVHDDTAAINAAIAAAKAVNGTVYFPQPSVAFKVTSEIPVHWGTARLVGQADGNPLVPCIRAHAAMRSVLEIRTTFDLSPPDRENEGVSRGYFANLTIDANFNARQAILENGDEYSTYERIQVQNALESGIRSGIIQAGVTIGSITQAGGGAAITVTQADINYYLWQQLGLSGGTIQLKITGGGTTYAVSYDGGATFQLGDQAVRLNRPTNITVTDGSSRVTALLGLQVNWGASVANGATYTFTVTPNNGDLPPNFFAGNGDCTFRDVSYDQCSSFYHTAGLSGSFGFYNGAIIVGSMSATAGNQKLTFTGTLLMNQVGAGYSRVVVMVNGPNFFQGLIVDDLTAVTVIGGEPPTNLTNVAFGIINLAGRYEDGQGEGARAKITGGVIANCACGFSLAGQFAGNVKNVSANVAIMGISLGGNGNNANQGQTIEHWHSSSNASNSFIMAPTSSGTVQEPEVQINVFGVATGGWGLIDEGNFSPLQNQSASSYLPVVNRHHLPSTQTLTSASQAIVPADQAFLGNTAHSSYVRLNLSAGLAAPGFLVLTGAPTIATPPGAVTGQLLTIQNVSSVPITFQDTSGSINTGLILENHYVSIGTLEYITFQYQVIQGQQFWVQVGAIGQGYQITLNAIGNRGKVSRSVITTNNTPTIIWDTNVSGSSVAQGTIQKFDITAQSALGVNVGAWLGNVVCYDRSAAGHIFFQSLPAGVGTNAGAPPAGWAITVDPSGTAHPNIRVTGDNTANAVAWLIVMENRDPGVA